MLTCVYIIHLQSNTVSIVYIYTLFCVSMSIIIRVLLSDFTIIIVLDVIYCRYNMRILQKWVGLIVWCASFRANP